MSDGQREYYGVFEAPEDDPVKTLRDEFAMAALAGMMASQFVSEHAGMHKTDSEMVTGLGVRAYMLADSMLAARDAPPQGGAAPQATP